jgi:hypothetical protein
LHREHRYQQYYCEENIYLLSEDLLGSHRRLQVLFISNSRKACLFHHQSSAAAGTPLIWDYHVVLLDGPHRDPVDAPLYRIFDFDTRLGFGIDAERYLRSTFRPPGPQRFRPLFRLIPVEIFLTGFSTDRRHMREDPENPDSPWLQPPPPWDPPRGSGAASPHELPRFISMEPEGPGLTVHLDELLEVVSSAGH